MGTRLGKSPLIINNEFYVAKYCVFDSREAVMTRVLSMKQLLRVSLVATTSLRYESVVLILVYTTLLNQVDKPLVKDTHIMQHWHYDCNSQVSISVIPRAFEWKKKNRPRD